MHVCPPLTSVQTWMGRWHVGVLRLLLPIQWRLLIAGCVVSIVSIVLLIAKGVHPFYFVLLAVGIVVLLVGLVLLLRSRRG